MVVGLPLSFKQLFRILWVMSQTLRPYFMQSMASTQLILAVSDVSDCKKNGTKPTQNQRQTDNKLSICPSHYFKRCETWHSDTKVRALWPFLFQNTLSWPKWEKHHNHQKPSHILHWIKLFNAWTDKRTHCRNFNNIFQPAGTDRTNKRQMCCGIILVAFW